LLVDIARELGESGGVFGARLTGGGFGGSTVTLVRTEHVDAVAETLTREYRRRTGRTAALFVSPPARGARLVAPPMEDRRE
jgi:galactokinase